VGAALAGDGPQSGPNNPNPSADTQDNSLMPQADITNSRTRSNLAHSYGPPQRLFTVIPGIPIKQAKAQASKLMDCARYLNHTGVMLGDHRMVAASHHLNTMVSALLDHLEDELPSLPESY